jgi:hypothetical protein
MKDSPFVVLVKSVIFVNGKIIVKFELQGYLVDILVKNNSP